MSDYDARAEHPELFDEDGLYLGGRSDYGTFTCRTCGQEQPGLDPRDAAEAHDLYEDHPFELAEPEGE